VWPQVSAVIAAVDEIETLPRVLAEVRRVAGEAIVVVNGPDDRTARAAATAGARVVRYDTQVGHDVGRALGAAQAGGDVLLFLDADLPVPAADLRPFCTAVLAGGVDVALNQLDRYIHPDARLHPVNAAKRFLNCALGRPDLGCASLTAVPHGLSRRALGVLGVGALAVPPLAMARALAAGLTVTAVHGVDVVRPNARRPGLNLGRSSPVEQLILGDHLEAIHWVLGQTGDPRGGLSDLGRRRELLPR
jgi:glycosyltransferase involved in cell wall biosynthesis